MKPSGTAKTTAIGIAAGMLAACGGGSSGGNPSQTPGAGVNFSVPGVNSQRIYSITDVDNLANSVNFSSQQTVTAVNADGTFVVAISDAGGNAVTLDGSTYSMPPALDTVDATGHLLSATFSPPGAPSFTCTYSPHGAGPVFPLTTGATWTLAFTEQCGSAPSVNYVQTGSVLDEESVTVPAGTFSTIKLQSTITWTTTGGTQVTESITRWLDVNTGAGVKETSVYGRTGTSPPNAYLTSQTVVLASAH